MELTPGYRRTDVGAIPVEWEIVTLASVSRIIDSLHRTPFFSERGHPMVRVADIKTGNLCLKGALRVDDDVFAEFTKTYKPSRNDIVVSRVGSYGISSFVETGEPFCLGQNTVVLHPTKAPARYLYYVLNSHSIREQIENGSYGSGYKSLSLKHINELLLPLPPTWAEQEAIAEALNDADDLIESLEQLIEKKRLLKHGAMQELLTGKKRLPGLDVGRGYKDTEIGLIPRDWELRPLLTAVRIAQGQVDPKIEPYASMFLVGPIHVESGTGKLLTRQTAEEQGAISGKYLFAEGDIVYGKINPYLQKAFLANFSGLCSADM